MTLILLADDEPRIREVAQYALEKEGFSVECVGDGALALERVRKGGVDLVVLDVMMPTLDGLSVVRKLRADAATESLPVLFLSARGEELDRVLGLELGGDDYLVKPFSPRELVARVRALVRRSGRDAPASERVVTHKSLRIDLDRWEAFANGESVDLTRTELMLLVALLERPGLVLSRAQLVKRAYPYDNLITERTIDTHVRRVRAKLRPFGVDPISTVHGVGYKASDA